MPAGDLTIVANAESWAGVGGPNTTPATDSFAARLITAASRYIANYLNRDLLTLGGQGYSVVATISTDAGGAFLTLKTGLGVTPDNPGGILPDLAAPVTDLTTGARTSVVASASPIGFPASPTKIYVASTSGFVAGDSINVTVYPTYPELHSGRGTPTLILNEWPLFPPGTITSLNLNGTPIIPAVIGTSTPAALGVDGYTVRNGVDTPAALGYWIGFTRSVQNVKAVYRAGYPSPPSDLEQVCIELVGLKIKERDRIGQTGKSIGMEHTSFIIGPMTKSNKDYLANYKRNTPRWS